MSRPPIPYSGAEPRAPKGSYLAACDRAYERFAFGRNTLHIGKIEGIPEHEALRRVTIGRSRALNLPIPVSEIPA